MAPKAEPVIPAWAVIDPPFSVTPVAAFSAAASESGPVPASSPKPPFLLVRVLPTASPFAVIAVSPVLTTVPPSAALPPAATVTLPAVMGAAWVKVPPVSTLSNPAVVTAAPRVTFPPRPFRVTAPLWLKS